ncbi:hypothetical protein WDW86_12090 [Bdellovibrionota bacterium FG-2]
MKPPMKTEGDGGRDKVPFLLRYGEKIVDDSPESYADVVGGNASSSNSMRAIETKFTKVERETTDDE